MSAWAGSLEAVKSGIFKSAWKKSDWVTLLLQSTFCTKANRANG